MKHLVIGLGEVGSALQSILKCDGHDPIKNIRAEGTYDVIHVCFPYGGEQTFFVLVDEYRNRFQPQHIVIHSTVPVGTSSKLGAIHSPIRGVHPHLEQSIRTFVKYLGGKDAHVIAKEFMQHGITCEVTDKPETTELMKLVDTTSYGVNILIEKEIHRLCKEYGVPFEVVYNDANFTYNRGYLKLKMPHFQKYNLQHRDGPIGGHCIMPNSKLLKSWMNDLLNLNEINK